MVSFTANPLFDEEIDPLLHLLALYLALGYLLLGQWNGKLTWPFGGGASPAYRSGRNDVTSALQDIPLSLGFAVAFGTRNTLGTGSDDVVSAETLKQDGLVRER